MLPSPQHSGEEESQYWQPWLAQLRKSHSDHNCYNSAFVISTETSLHQLFNHTLATSSGVALLSLVLISKFKNLIFSNVFSYSAIL